MTRFSDFLKNEYVRRKLVNSRFSMRSFALRVGLTSSYLSKIMRHERQATARTIHKVGQNLGLSNKQIKMLVSTEKSHRPIRSGQLRFKKLDLRMMKLVFDWRNDVVLELIKLNQFKPDVRWVASQIGVTESQAQGYLDSLFQLGLLISDKKGNWTDSTGGFTTFIEDPRVERELRRNRQIEILTAAIEAVKTYDLSERDQSAMVMATNSKKLKAAKIKIAKFRRDLCRFLEDTAEKDVVFQLSVSLFPVTKQNKNNEVMNDNG